MSIRERLRQLLREPIVHFLIGGLAIFLFFAWRGVEADPESRTIVIDKPQVERLAAQFTQNYRRAPTPDEIDGLIRDYIQEEVYYREALRLGLDSDDPVIRNRLRQKMEFLARSSVENEQPDEADLQRLLAANPVRYAADAAYSFDQIYLAPGDSGDVSGRAIRLLADLQRGKDWQKMGDPLSLPRAMENTVKADIERDFGDRFASQVAHLAKEPLNVWRGPVPSGYGMHLVRLRSATVPTPPKLADVRVEVENDWRENTIQAREAQAYQALLSGYSIRIAKP